MHRCTKQKETCRDNGGKLVPEKTLLSPHKVYRRTYCPIYIPCVLRRVIFVGNSTVAYVFLSQFFSVTKVMAAPYPFDQESSKMKKKCENKGMGKAIEKPLY